MREAINNLLKKYRKQKLKLMEERREYKTDYAHNWSISCLQEIEKDLKFIIKQKEVKE